MYKITIGQNWLNTLTDTDIQLGSMIVSKAHMYVDNFDEKTLKRIGNRVRLNATFAVTYNGGMWCMSKLSKEKQNQVALHGGFWFEGGVIVTAQKPVGKGNVQRVRPETTAQIFNEGKGARIRKRVHGGGTGLVDAPVKCQKAQSTKQAYDWEKKMKFCAAFSESAYHATVRREQANNVILASRYGLTVKSKRTR